MAKIAAASTDGKLVNQHFGRADIFYILDADEETAQYHLLEIRKVSPICIGGDHDENSLRDNVNSLSDCEAVLVSRIGMRARGALEAKGIEVYEIPGMIDESIDKLVRYKKVQKYINL